jgi:hypothetical protein
MLRTPVSCAAATSFVISSIERLNTPGIDEISRRTLVPGQTKSGNTKFSGASRVSRTSERMASLLRVDEDDES